jgi:hypothetical protein
LHPGDLCAIRADAARACRRHNDTAAGAVAVCCEVRNPCRRTDGPPHSCKPLKLPAFAAARTYGAQAQLSPHDDAVRHAHDKGLIFNGCACRVRLTGFRIIFTGSRALKRESYLLLNKDEIRKSRTAGGLVSNNANCESEYERGRDAVGFKPDRGDSP